MSQPRPLGLTALAATNFLLGVLGGAALLLAYPSVGVVAAQYAVEQGILVVSLVAATFAWLLMVVAGVGYLRRQRFLGRSLGTLYALVALAGRLFELFAIPDSAGVLTFAHLVHPAVTLLLVQGIYRGDFDRP